MRIEPIDVSVPDIVEADYVYALGAARVFAAHPPADHLHKQNVALGRPCKENGLDIRDIAALRKHLNVYQHIQLPFFEALDLLRVALVCAVDIITAHAA